MDYRSFIKDSLDRLFSVDGGGVGDLSGWKSVAYRAKEKFEEKFSKNHVVRSVIAVTFDAASTVASMSLCGVESEASPLPRAIMKRYGLSSIFLWDLVFTYPAVYGISLAADYILSRSHSKRLTDAIDKAKDVLGAKSIADTSLAMISLLQYYAGASNTSDVLAYHLPDPYKPWANLSILLFLVPYVNTLIKKKE